MSISGIQSQSIYTSLASGYKINSAADNAAGLSISEKLTAQENGYNVASSNAQDGISLINVTDGALAGMQDSLQRIHELAVQSLNGFYSDSDKASIQAEIDQLKQSIQATAKNTTFNSLKPLDGSMADIELATNPEGSGLKIQLENSTLESLGIADFDVTGDFNLDDIKNAMERISKVRSGLGAQSNALEYTIRGNDYTSYNTVATNSRLKDTEYGEALIKRDRDEALQQYRMWGIRAKKEQDAGILKLF